MSDSRSEFFERSGMIATTARLKVAETRIRRVLLDEKSRTVRK